MRRVPAGRRLLAWTGRRARWATAALAALTLVGATALTATATATAPAAAAAQAWTPKPSPMTTPWTNQVPTDTPSPNIHARS